MKHKTNAIFFLAIFLLSCALSAYAAPRLEIDYPSLPPLAPAPPSSPIENAALTKYVVYIFGFSVIVSSILALIMIAIGAVKYIYSAGSPSVIKDATGKIMSAVLGLVILTTSYVILYRINPNFVTISDPKISPTIPKLNYGVWACTERMKSNIDWMWNAGKLKKPSKSDTQTYSKTEKIFLSACFHVTTEMGVPSNVKGKVGFIYLVPEEGKRDFGTIIYQDATPKSQARVVYGNGSDNTPPLYAPVEWPLLNMDTTSIRFKPFELINNSPTSWYAKFYELVHLNRGNPDAKKATCSTMGKREVWCDIYSLSPTPESTPSPGESTPSPGETGSSFIPEFDSLGIILAQSEEMIEEEIIEDVMPPKISSVEINGNHFVIFFKNNTADFWTTNTTLDVVGPSTENNLSSGKYIMGEWNEACKERKAEEPNKETYYPCANSALLVSAKFL